MDIFGIGSAVKAALGMYRSVSRGTGRTTAMIWSLKPGDRIIFTNGNEATRVKRLCYERDIEGVEFVVVSPKDPQEIFNRGTPQGKIIFDHTWVEEFYQDAIERAEKNINYFQKECSGYGEEHIKTKLAAKEYSRMMQYLPR